MTEVKLIDKVNNTCEDILYMLTKVDSITEEGKLVMKNKLKEVQSEIQFKKIDWSVEE